MTAEIFFETKKHCFNQEELFHMYLSILEFLKKSQNSQKKSCARVSFLKNFVKKESPGWVFSCAFCKVFIDRAPVGNYFCSTHV